MPVKTGVPGVPVPVRGYYWGGTNNNDQSTVPGCPPSAPTASGGYADLECKITWAAGRLGLASQAALSGGLHTSLARAYLNGDLGCRNDQSRLQPGGDIFELASRPGRQALLLSTKCGSWHTLATGGGRSPQDTYLRQVVDLAGKLPVPVILVFHHEPEDDACSHGSAGGTPDDYRAAYRQFAQDVREGDARDGKLTISTGWVMMNATMLAHGEGDRAAFTGCAAWKPNDTSTDNPLRNPDNWYPGDDAVDWLAADVYTHGPRNSLRAAVASFVDWADAACPGSHPSANWNCSAARAQKPLALAEFGPGLGKRVPTQVEKARWFDQLRTDLADPKVTVFARIKAFAYWSSGGQNTIDMPFDPGHPALLAYTRLSLSPLARPTLPSS